MLIIKIKVAGHLDPRWENLFDGLKITHQIEDDHTPVTLLVGDKPDQSAVYGCLTCLKNLGVSLISLETRDSD